VFGGGLFVHITKNGVEGIGGIMLSNEGTTYKGIRHVNVFRGMNDNFNSKEGVWGDIGPSLTQKRTFHYTTEETSCFGRLSVLCVEFAVPVEDSSPTEAVSFSVSGPPRSGATGAGMETAGPNQKTG